MKRLEISRLMDEYVDDEIFPQGGETADAQTVKDRVLAKAAPAKKRRKPLKMALLAAALAVGCALCIAAGLPTTVYHLVTGGTVTVQRGPDGYTSYDFSNQFPNEPVAAVSEDGRVWLTLNGERTDITDQIDMETPYIVEGTDPASGLSNFLIVGGTPEDLGYCSFVETSSGDYSSGGNGNCYTEYCTLDGKTYAHKDLTEEQRDKVPPASYYLVWRPWYLNGVEQLRERGFNIR